MLDNVTDAKKTLLRISIWFGQGQNQKATSRDAGGGLNADRLLIPSGSVFPAVGKFLHSNEWNRQDDAENKKTERVEDGSLHGLELSRAEKNEDRQGIIQMSQYKAFK